MNGIGFFFVFLWLIRLFLLWLVIFMFFSVMDVLLERLFMLCCVWVGVSVLRVRLLIRVRCV